MFFADPSQNNVVARFIEEGISILTTREVAPEDLPLLATSWFEVVDHKYALVCHRQVCFKAFVGFQACDNVVYLGQREAGPLEMLGGGVDEDGLLLGRRRSINGGAGESQGGQDGCENGGGLHLDGEPVVGLGQSFVGEPWEWE